jgi:hypothetical protein
VRRTSERRPSCGRGGALEGAGELTAYERSPPAIAVPLGPEGGAGQFPGQEGIVGAETVAEVKGRHMMVGTYAEILGRPVPVRG